MSTAPLFNDIADGPSGGEARWATCADGTRIRIAFWPGGGRGTVFLFPGRSEYIEKYGPAARELGARGYSTLTADWRGQGLSDRKLRVPMIGHIGNFAEYQQDVQAMLDMAVHLGLPQPWFLLSHSMGGTIALRSLADGLPFQSAVFSAPMWGILFPRNLRPVAIAVSAMALIAGQSHRLTPMTTATNYMATAPFEGNLLTKNQVTFDWLRMQASTRPELAVGGPSLGWLRAALSECSHLMRRRPPDVPALAVLGDDERIVDPRAVRRFMAGWASGRLETYPGAEHEIMMEHAPHRSRFFDSTAALFASGQ